ncbi:regulatory protein RecX [Ideonella sp. A 288]|uniref:regulatory protein RecX n=1 Tax=Ideonella sp. A 288 TaxID=1962181 RepID=UPI003855EA33
MKGRAVQWLAQREHSRSELRTKLLNLVRRQAAAAAAEPPDEALPDDDAEQRVDALLDWLSAQGHLSEARFVESRVHARQRRYGNLRIRQELQQHGLSLDDDTRRALDASEIARATDVCRRKFPERPADASARAKQVRFLAGRGFSAEVVRAVLRRDPSADEDAGPGDD